MHPFEEAIIFLLEIQQRHLGADVRKRAAELEAACKADVASRLEAAAEPEESAPAGEAAHD